MATYAIYLFAAILFISALIPFLFFLIHRRSRIPLDVNERSLLSTSFGFFNALYAFLLSFAVITLWSQVIDAQDDVGREAQTINTMYHLALLIPDSDDLKHALIDYNNCIIDDEWKEMAVHRCISEKTQTAFHNIWYRIHTLPLKSQREILTYQEILEKVEDLSQLRVQRFLLIRGHLYPLIWIIIIVGGICAIVGFYYFGTEKLKIQLIFDFIFIFIMLLTIWLITELNYPYDGWINVSPEPFKVVRDRMNYDELYDHRFKRQDRINSEKIKSVIEEKKEDANDRSSIPPSPAPSASSP
ncbi:MAG: hypothetical protein RDV48_26540 [Candidatus Eremiobacteraeota bacterium]|nr:hypothetical protein [Candidatus Eremiobacteraeota bacterium]